MRELPWPFWYADAYLRPWAYMHPRTVGLENLMGLLFFYGAIGFVIGSFSDSSPWVRTGHSSKSCLPCLELCPSCTSFLDCATVELEFVSVHRVCTLSLQCPSFASVDGGSSCVLDRATTVHPFLECNASRQGAEWCGYTRRSQCWMRSTARDSGWCTSHSASAPTSSLQAA